MLVRPQEHVCLDARRHGVVLVRPFLKALLLAAAGAALLTRPWPVSVLGAAALAAAALLAVPAVWRWERTRLVVTRERLLVVHGTLRRRAAAVPLSRVAPVEVEQTLAGRLLGYGTLVAGDLEIAYVADPRRVYGLLERLSV
jgi:membrane protein YdbS with pleckstrin-like domain